MPNRLQALFHSSTHSSTHSSSSPFNDNNNVNSHWSSARERAVGRDLPLAPPPSPCEPCGPLHDVLRTHELDVTEVDRQLRLSNFRDVFSPTVTAANLSRIIMVGTAAPETDTADVTVPGSSPTPSINEHSGSPQWPELEPEHPLRQFQGRLAEILDDAGYSEIYAVNLSAADPVPFTTTLILQKFLRANDNHLEKAVEQLRSTLKWRKEFEPLKAAEETYDIDTFGGLGYITGIEEGDGGKHVVTWNIYGAAKDTKKVFGDVEAFTRWRVALMERSLRHLSLATAKVPIPDAGAGPDPYQMTQVHDYLSVKFLRMDPMIRTASRRVITLFQANYPELLARKFFVNVPFVMSWVYAAMKAVMANETSKKLTMLSYGSSLAADMGPAVPKAYGGQGRALEEAGETVRLGKVEGKPREGSSAAAAVAAASGAKDDGAGGANAA
ncbi:MAG: Non-classical phosphatidylinositol transfer protein (PITP) [Piccolia ochrophora]|nr:MAG: Non-classical phosphatidylinositol transfer protein (PITP) [Piccolia ochrophora]